MRTFSTFFKYPLLVLCFVSIVALNACKEDDPGPATNENEYVNDWIFENMQAWYYWEDQLPSSPDKTPAPSDFFESLLVDEDHFSWIQENYEELLNSLQGINKEAGFEFTLYRESESSDNIFGQILYIKPSSPAAAAGLERGDIFAKINGQQLTINNYQNILGSLDEPYTMTYKELDIEAETFSAEKTASLTPVQYSENPNFYHDIIIEGERKIGYFVYNFFSAGTDADEDKYDNEVDAIFADFQAGGITDLILDLRYNSGGSETSATNLASLIAPNVNNTKVFFKREYNDQIEEEIINNPNLGTAFLSSKFVNKTQNIGSQLTNSRVYILTSSRTASASELIINGLRPYMDVFLIGKTTYGKNVGSISLYEENDPKNTWGMQPIVVKAFNSQNQSDYSNGFTPDVENLDNSIFLFPIGDTREAMLADAIEEITGVPSGGRTATRRQLRTQVGHSLDFKRSSFTLLTETPDLK
jgi:carboxyl-terminal processing protease